MGKEVKIALIGLLTAVGCGIAKSAPTPTAVETGTPEPTPTPKPRASETPTSQAEITGERLDTGLLVDIPGTNKTEASLGVAAFSKANLGNSVAEGVTLLTVDGAQVQRQIQYLDAQKRIIAESPLVLPKEASFDERGQVAVKKEATGKITAFALEHRHFAQGTHSWLASKKDGTPLWVNADGNGKALSVEDYWQPVAAGTTSVALNLNPAEQGFGGQADGRLYQYDEQKRIVSVSRNILVAVHGGVAATGGGENPAAGFEGQNVINFHYQGERPTVENPLTEAQIEEQQKAAEALSAVASRGDVFEVFSKAKDGTVVIGRYAATPTEGPQQFWLWYKGQWQKVSQPQGVVDTPVFDPERGTLVWYKDGKMSLFWDPKTGKIALAVPPATPTPEPTREPPKVRYNVDALDVYAAINGSKTGTIQKLGVEFTVLETKEGWAHVQSAGFSGWVPADQLTAKTLLKGDPWKNAQCSLEEADLGILSDEAINPQGLSDLKARKGYVPGEIQRLGDNPGPLFYGYVAIKKVDFKARTLTVEAKDGQHIFQIDQTTRIMYGYNTGGYVPVDICKLVKASHVFIYVKPDSNGDLQDGNLVYFMDRNTKHKDNLSLVSTTQGKYRQAGTPAVRRATFEADIKGRGKTALGVWKAKQYQRDMAKKTSIT